ncbi:hypothetical protein B0H13DRAFT_1924163 [Mycena leptocephala]|nr:hypothetical protein B0H13DRAFT_1924163 [Mycena leptocephala]
MAVYYDEYGDYAYENEFLDHPELAYDADPHHCDAGYFLAPADYYESCDEYSYRDAHPTFDNCEPYASSGSGYKDVEKTNAGCMRIAYGEPGYWEEYQRRRYEIIYGADSGEEADTLEDDAEPALDAAAADDPYEEPDELHEYAVEVARIPCVEEDAAAAWVAMWERGSLVGENELAWAEAMDAWRQNIEAQQVESESVVDALDAYAAAEENLNKIKFDLSPCRRRSALNS